MTDPLDPLLSETELGPELESPETAASPGGEAAAWGFFRFLREKILPALITLLLISLIVFVATHTLGIDVGRRALGRQATPQQLAEFNHAHGLDRPIYVQYGAWLGDFVRGDWGISSLNNRPVFKIVVPRLLYTLVLAVVAIAVAVPLSILFGVYLARPGSRVRELGLSIATVGVAAVPVFVIGIVLIYFFSVSLGWTPVDSSALSFGTFPEKVAAFVLPTTALVISLIPHISRLTQVSVRETMTTPYARAAVLRGLSRRTIVRRHLMPNAAGPIINVVALDLIWLVGGVIIVENVFGFPGLGTLLVQSIAAGDLITVQAVAVITGALFIGISLVADLLVTVFNPRLRNG
jgi:peptide/nickel transport system permease protein